MRSHKIYKHIINTNVFNVSKKINDFRKPKNDNKNRKNKS